MYSRKATRRVPFNRLPGRRFRYHRLAPSRRRMSSSHICHDYQLGRCTAETVQLDGKLIYCTGGFHPTAEQLANPKEFAQLIGNTLLSRIKPHKCAICLEQMIEGEHKFGLLNACSHFFCANCTVKWMKSDPNKQPLVQGLTCPLCRVHSTKVMLWGTVPTDQRAKNNLFALWNQPLHTESSFTSSSSLHGSRYYALLMQNNRVRSISDYLIAD